MLGTTVSGLVRNTLTSPLIVEKILNLPRHEQLYGALLEIVLQFQKMKNFASEIQTELQLVKPVLKILGYAFDSKAKVFEEHVKGPDFALFASEEERSKSSALWGTKQYYEHVLGVLGVKRYGRNLEEGISGFYLEFENRIPVYQVIYLVKTLGVPWGILTNGKRWILIKRPVGFEKQILEVDLEQSALSADPDSLHLFFHVFSSKGLITSVPGLLEEEREGLVHLVQQKRDFIGTSLGESTRKMEVYPRIVDLCREFFPSRQFPLTKAYLGVKENDTAPVPGNGYGLVNEQNEAELFTYLLTTNETPSPLSLEELFFDEKKKDYTKEEFLSLKVLDMTPGCGTTAVQLVEAFTYLSLSLPYKEKNTFVAEWESELTLNRYILDNAIYGIEKFHPSLDILQNALESRFHLRAANYRLGNPLLGMSLRDLQGLLEDKKQAGLFARHPKEALDDLRTMYCTYSSLSGKIKEDALIKNELGDRLSVYRERIGDIMDLFTSTYFSKKAETKRIRELLFGLEGDEGQWQAARRTEWFQEAKGLARRNSFFHMEIEFPFLLADRFDIIIIQPTLRYQWEEDVPATELARAYIKRAATYLKQNGRIVLSPGEAVQGLISELKKSKTYEVEPGKHFLVLRRR